MTDEPRYVISDITIRNDGDWYSGQSRIENKSILLYFKKNLYSDINGLFILNQFGLKTEKVYIKANGPVLKVTGIREDKFILDNEEVLDIALKEIVMDSQERFYIVIEKLKAWGILTRGAVDDLRDRLTREGDIYFWNKRPIRRMKEIPWFFG